jgi:MerR family transcriptional regulator, light-induced transcriptional regulator
LVSADDPRYRIGMLAQLTGVSTHALRAWERRYGAFAPARTPKGARLYADADVQRVLLLKALLDRGHSIGNMAVLPMDRLRELASELDRVKPAQPPVSTNENAVVSALLAAVMDLEIDAAARILTRAGLVFSPRDLALKVLAPLLEQVGTLWQNGELPITSEHAISALLRTQLGQFLNAIPVERTPAILCSTPAGERHELGALLVAVLIALRGRRALYLGADLPARQIVDAVRVTGATAIALSVVSLDPERASKELSEIANALPASIELLVGGRGVRNLPQIPDRARVLQDLPALEAWLDRSGARA